MTQTWLRWMISTGVGVLALLITLLGPLAGQAQPPRFPFNPPGVPGGNPYPGGMPITPVVPPVGPPGGNGFGGGFGGGGFGGFQDEWYCTGCRKTLGTGPVKPAHSSCPFCGVKFINGGPDLGAPFVPTMPATGGGFPPAAGGGFPPVTTTPAPNNPTYNTPQGSLPVGEGTNIGGFGGPTGPGYNAGVADPTTTNPAGSPNSLFTPTRIIIGVIAIAVALGVILVAVVIIVLRSLNTDAPSAQPARRRRRLATQN